MSVSRETLAAASAETGFRPETLEKVVRLGQLAHDIARQPVLSRALALKGGTALNLCFGPPRRLSVDLDLNYVASVDRARMLKDRPEIQRLIREIAEGRLTKNLYRREWRRGGIATHDDPLAVTVADRDRQRLVVAPVQEKVSEVLGHERFKKSFQIGMLASFESFLETAKAKKRGEDDDEVAT
jgi:predicted nucleotidyltransferase component of viral defense system